MTDKELVLKFLREEKVATLATVTKKGTPDAATIYYFVDDELNLFFPTKAGTQKYKNIEHQDEVVLVVTDPVKKRTAKIRGTAIALRDEAVIVDALGRFSALLNGEEGFDTVLPILKRHEGDFLLIQVQPQNIRFTDYSGKDLQEMVVSF